MKGMKVRKYLLKKIKKGEKIHFSLIDPVKRLRLEYLEIARKLERCGTDAILIGGSTKISRKILDGIVKEIKENIKIPIILFPSSRSYISKYCDAILFISLLNSTDPRYIVGEQARGAVIIKKIEIEVIPTAYLVFEPGMAVGKKGKAKVLSHTDYNKAVQYALYAQILGFSFIYLETGSGGFPLSDKMIKTIRKETEIPLIVGGGIRTAEIAREKIKAGADIIVTGNIIEEDLPDLSRVQKIISAIKNAQS